MTGPQAALAAILVVALASMGWNRVRADIVAVAALLGAVVAGVVPAARLLAGFSEPVILVVAALGVIAAGLRGSGVLAGPVRMLAPVLERVGAQVALLGGMGAMLAAAVGRSGAQSAFLPVPGQVLRARFWPSPATVPVGLAVVVGGMATPLGSPATLLAAGAGLGLLDFVRVGGPLAAGGLIILAVAWRLAPRRAADAAQRQSEDRFVSEVHVPAGSPAIGRALSSLQRGGPLGVVAVVREEFRRMAARPSLVIEADDVLVLSAGTDRLQQVIEQLRGRIAGAGDARDSLGVVEAVVTPGSRMIGLSAADGGLTAARIGLLGIGRDGGVPLMRLGRVKLRAGDVLVLQGELERMPAVLASLGCLKLAERRLRLRRAQRALVPGAAVLGVLAALAWGVSLPVAVLAAVLVLLVAGSVGAGELYDGVDWPLVVSLAAALPLGTALAQTGLAESMADGMVQAVSAPALAWVAAVLAAGLAGAAAHGPVAAVLLLPVAGALATRLGVPGEPFIMAVAVGASATFRGLGGGRLAWVLAGFVLVAGTGLIGHAWIR